MNRELGNLTQYRQHKLRNYQSASGDSIWRQAIRGATTIFGLNNREKIGLNLYMNINCYLLRCIYFVPRSDILTYTLTTSFIYYHTADSDKEQKVLLLSGTHYKCERPTLHGMRIIITADVASYHIYSFFQLSNSLRNVTVQFQRTSRSMWTPISVQLYVASLAQKVRCVAPLGGAALQGQRYGNSFYNTANRGTTL